MLVGLMIISRYHHPTPAAGAVEIAAAGLRSDQQVLKELVAAFDQAEIAVQQANLEALMSFYGKDYNYHGLRRPDVRRVWSEVFSHYGHVRSRHVFSDLQVVQEGSQKQAFVTCTGGLYGTDKDSGRSITIDSWVGEVHSKVMSTAPRLLSLQPARRITLSFRPPALSALGVVSDRRSTSPFIL
jgi:hypothetical protein